ncbi:hypothetical protein BJ322DRAFT_1017056 [Thelephora terrestris]|uniref:Uncharacterized protein n=1 Tax=Thelephora terrestris TaxID=56493 RepID=A0A9P6LB33_9AGAM|nr:hypothetical protein BJ322DRAFT_1017056 [Thelephora terrestris]
MFTILNKWCPPAPSLSGLVHPQRPANLPPTTSSDHQPPPTPPPATPSQNMDPHQYVQMRKAKIDSFKNKPQSWSSRQQAVQTFSKPGSQGALVFKFEPTEMITRGWVMQQWEIFEGLYLWCDCKLNEWNYSEEFNFANTTLNVVSNYYDDYQEDHQENDYELDGEGNDLMAAVSPVSRSPDENSWFECNDVNDYEYEDDEMDGDYYEDGDDVPDEEAWGEPAPLDVKDVDDVIGDKPAFHRLAELEDRTVDNPPHTDPDVEMDNIPIPGSSLPKPPPLIPSQGTLSLLQKHIGPKGFGAQGFGSGIPPQPLCRIFQIDWEGWDHNPDNLVVNLALRFFQAYPHTYAAALSAGGVLWKIAMDVLPPPQESDITRLFHLEACSEALVNGVHYWTPDLTEAQEDVVIGVSTFPTLLSCTANIKMLPIYTNSAPPTR